MSRDDARRWARRIAGLRAGLGIAAILAPGLVGRPWSRQAAGRPVNKLLTRSIGARDVALGLGAILALDRGGPTRGWVEAGALADAGDVVGTLVARHSVPWPVRWVIMPMTAALVVQAARVAPSVD